MRKNVNNDVSKDSPIHLVHRAPTDKLRKAENNVIIFLKIIKPDICIIFSFSRTAPAEYANLRKADFARVNRAIFYVDRTASKSFSKLSKQVT